MKILIAIIIFGLIIFIHELGHFLLAKLNHITVIEFAIGMGPRLCGFEKGGTKYSLRAFPLGGFCNMLGENSDEQEADENSFNSKNVWRRMSVIIAGPGFNFILAFLLSIIITASLGYTPSRVTDAAPSTGLQAGDIITKIDNDSITLSDDIEMHFTLYGINKDGIKVEYKRDGIKGETFIVPTETDKYVVGFGYTNNENPCVIESVTEGGPMDLMGIKPGYIIKKINGTVVNSGKEVNTYFISNPMNGTPIVFEIDIPDGDAYVTKEYTINPKFSSTVYSVDFTYLMKYEKGNFFEIIKYSAINVRFWIESTIRSLGYMFSGKASINDISGPVAIVDTIGTTYDTAKKYGTAKEVFLTMVNMCILLSANLGVMNLLPFPALDGGRFLFLCIEAAIRRPLNRKIESIVNAIGFIILISFMVFILGKDIIGLFK